MGAQRVSWHRGSALDDFPVGNNVSSLSMGSGGRGLCTMHVRSFGRRGRKWHHVA